MQIVSRKLQNGFVEFIRFIAFHSYQLLQMLVAMGRSEDALKTNKQQKWLQRVTRGMVRALSASSIGKRLVEKAAAITYEDYANDTYATWMLFGNTVVYLLLAAGLGIFWPAVGLMAGYIGLGLFAHGFHVTSLVQCSAMNIVVQLAGALAATRCSIPLSGLALVLVCSYAVLFRWAPQISKHSFVPSPVREQHRKILLVIAAGYAAASLTAMVMGYTVIANLLWIALAIQAFAQTPAAFHIFEGKQQAGTEPVGIVERPRWEIPVKKLFVALLVVIPVVVMVGTVSVHACFEPWAWHTPGVSENRKAQIEARFSKAK